MSTNKVYQGWIYTITNKVNSKMYVGKTVNFAQRKWQHFHREQCSALKRAFAKYGVENFEMKSVLTFKAVNKEILNKMLCELEKHFIKKFDTFRSGYNCTKGGEGCLGYEHTDQYKQLMSKKQAEYKAQTWVKEKDKQRMLGNKLSEESKRPILRYDLLGNLIKEYSWIGEAIDDIISEGKYTNNWRTAHSNIIRALGNTTNKQHYNKAYNCMWKYKELNSTSATTEPYKRKEEKPLYHYSKEGKLLESYRTLKEAEALTEIPIRKLKYMSYNGDLRRREGRMPKTDYWSREGS